jgi:hypothetical protein
MKLNGLHPLPAACWATDAPCCSSLLRRRNPTRVRPHRSCVDARSDFQLRIPVYGRRREGAALKQCSQCIGVALIERGDVAAQAIFFLPKRSSAMA